MAIEKNNPEFELWKEAYKLRNKYHGMNAADDTVFKKLVEESRQLFEKYDNTSAHIPALWLSLAIREMFNEEVKKTLWED